MIGNFGSRATNNRRGNQLVDDEGFSETERLDWLYHHTEWGPDFDQGTHAKTMLRIWEAEKIPNQQWNVTCKRRRKSGGFSRLHRLHVETLSRFPSRATLEAVVLSLGYGGGEYLLTNTRGSRLAHRITVEGKPEDPYVVPEQPDQEASREEVLDQLEARLLKNAFRYLEENPVLGREVSLKIMEKKLGIKIRMPDRNAPVPYSELPVESQEWLDEHADDKDAYMRKALGLEEPEVEPTLEERVVEGIKDKIVEDVVASFGNRSSGWETLLADFLTKSNFNDVIELIVPLLSKRNGPTEDSERLPATDNPGKGLLPLESSHLGFNMN